MTADLTGGRCPVHPIEGLPCPRCRTHGGLNVLEPRLIENGPAGHLRGGLMQGEHLAAPVEVGAQTFEPRVAMAMCLNADQLAHAIVSADLHQELVKVEVVPAFDPNGRRSYRVTLWSLPWP